MSGEVKNYDTNDHLCVRFEVGKRYYIGNSQVNIIEIVNRTKCFVTISGMVNGKCKIHVNHSEMGDEEVIIICSGKYRENFSICSALNSVDNKKKPIVTQDHGLMQKGIGYKNDGRRID